MLDMGAERSELMMPIFPDSSTEIYPAVSAAWSEERRAMTVELRDTRPSSIRVDSATDSATLEIVIVVFPDGDEEEIANVEVA
jgi:hypothetical protein